VQEYGVIAFTTEMYELQFSPADSSLPFALTDCPALFCCSITVRDAQQTAAAEQSSYFYMSCSTHTARAINI